MRMLATLLATAALVAGVTIANAQSPGSPTQPAGPKAGGHDPNNPQPGRSREVRRRNVRRQRSPLPGRREAPISRQEQRPAA